MILTRHGHADIATVQCTTYHNHAITTLTFGIITTVLVLMIPILFIPTPRTYLLFTLLFLGLGSLITDMYGHYRQLQNPSSAAYLPWCIAETTILIAYANLPFLSSLFSSTNAARYRHLSSMTLPTWPHSSKDSPPRADRHRPASTATRAPSPRSQRLDSTVSETDDSWNESTLMTVPPLPVRKLSLNDPPPELEIYWSARMNTAKDVDLEMARAEMEKR